MGRVSKRTFAPAGADKEPKVRYKAGIYARLSSDQDSKPLKGHKGSKNESVEVQVRIAEKHIEELNREGTERIEIADRYIDLGKTGSNFNRDEFQRLMQDIRLGDIDCVVVKDLSRFGRNYLEAGNYIEKIFPFLGVRFIAVADGLDTGDKGSNTKQMSTAMAVEIKNLVNDMYAKDFSVRAKQHLKQRRQEGSYVGGPPPYGYKAGWDKKIRKLVPDDNTAGIVKHIFSMFIETESFTAVADDLNRKKCNPPSVYKKTGKVFFDLEQGEYKGWDKGAVERIVKSEAYTGKLVQGKSSITARDEKNRIHKAEEEWVVKENTHEPVIDTAVFAEAAEVRERLHERTKSYTHKAEGFPIGENIFDSVLYCGVCGRKMTRNSYVKTYADGRKARLDGYFCLNGGQTKVENCPASNRISKAELVDILLPLLRMEFSVYLGKPKQYTEIVKGQLGTAGTVIDTKIRKAEKKIVSAKEDERTKYVEYREGIISQSGYVAYKMRQEGRLNDLSRQKEKLEADRKNLDTVSGKYLAAARALLRLKSGRELTKEMVESLIRKIYVYPGKRIEVEFAYTNELLEGVLTNG
ncbi:MAG: recombinase family protein [Lachnospiraceae bacterium]|nr:recombinase family protein [Lachnospiraceae bacterium]